MFDATKMTELGLAEVGAGYFENREYSNTQFLEFGANWPDAEQLLDDERSALEPLLEAGLVGSGLDSAIEGVMQEDDSWYFTGLDLGVCGICAVLSAAGCPTTFSCRGHGSGQPDYPRVHLYTSPERASLVSEACSKTGCEINNSEMGGAWIWSYGLPEILDLGDAIVSMRDSFATIRESQALVDLAEARRDGTVWTRFSDSH